MIRLGRSVVIIGALIVCTAQSPSPPSAPVSGTKVAVECDLPNGSFKLDDPSSASGAKCRAKLLEACPSGYHILYTDIETGSEVEKATLKITCR